MDISPFHAAASTVIAVEPEVAYDFIADMPRMGEISPQCTGGEWQGDERGVGASFLGSNAAGERVWNAWMIVVVADRPREFAWENHGSMEWEDHKALVRWGYTFEPVDGGTRVEETWRIVESYDALEAHRRGGPDGAHRVHADEHRADARQPEGDARRPEPGRFRHRVALRR